MESPCNNVCRLDPTGHICIGCRRTVDEIAVWASLSDVQRARIMAELANRRLPDATHPPRED